MPWNKSCGYLTKCIRNTLSESMGLAKFTRAFKTIMCVFLNLKSIGFFSFKTDGTEELELLATYRIVHVVFFSFQNS